MTTCLIRTTVVFLTVLFAVSSTVFADVKVLVIPKGTKAVFWKTVVKGALTAGNDLDIKVTCRGPATEKQYDAQIKIIEFGIEQEYDAIVLAPSHVDQACKSLKKAVDNGIQVVLIDSNMDCRHHKSLVESYNYRAGQMAANHLSLLLKNSGNIVLARHIENHASTHEREQGFLDTIQSLNPKLKIIADPYIGASLGNAYHSMLKIIDQFSSIDAIFSVGEEATLGTLRALKNRGLTGKTKFIGFDFDGVIGDAIVNHEMDATIVQNPFQTGYWGVKAAYNLTRNETVPEHIFTGTILVTADNFHTDEVNNIIGPYISPQE